MIILIIIIALVLFILFSPKDKTPPNKSDTYKFREDDYEDTSEYEIFMEEQLYHDSRHQEKED